MHDGNMALPRVHTSDELKDLCKHVRYSIFRMCQIAGSGHLGGSSSSVELLVALYLGGYWRFSDVQGWSPRDKVILRGHLGPLRYTIFSLLGLIDAGELATYRQFASRLQGHEDHLLLPWVDVSPAGSLGMVLSYGVGSAYADAFLNRAWRTFVFLGDGEEQEGNVSEAARHAAHLKLSNLFVIIDRNGKQLSCGTEEVDSTDLEALWDAYGWTVRRIKNGNDIDEVLAAYHDTLERSDCRRPTCLIAHTTKGYGLAGARAHVSGYHTIGVCPPEVVKEAIKHLETELQSGNLIQPTAIGPKIVEGRIPPSKTGWQLADFPKPSVEVSQDMTSAQSGYFLQLGAALKRLRNLPPAYFLTADVTYKSGIQEARIADFAQVLNVGLREQHMIAMAHGLALSDADALVIINCSDAFTYRALDQLHAAALGRGRFIIISDIAGLTECRNGRSHQTASHPLPLMGFPNMEFLEPGDVYDLFNCLNHAVSKLDKIYFIRVARAHGYQVGEQQAKRTVTFYTVRECNPCEVVLVGSGLMVAECVLAADRLRDRGVGARVINVINPNSLDEEFTASVTNGVPVLTFFNGNAECLQSKVAMSLSERSIRSNRVIGFGFNEGQSGDLASLLKFYRLDANAITEHVMATLQQGG